MKTLQEIYGSEIVSELAERGWKITSDGPNGVMLEGPKKMRTLDKLCLAFGILTFWLYGLGFFFIVAAMIDFHFLTKPETKFIPR